MLTCSIADMYKIFLINNKNNNYIVNMKFYYYYNGLKMKKEREKPIRQ